MNKLRGLFGDWSDSLYSCDVVSLENYLTKFKTVPTRNDLIYIKECNELFKLNPKPEYANHVNNILYLL